MRDFKIGDKIKCIKEPRSSEYYVKKGQILTIKKVNGEIIYTKEIIGDYISVPCYRAELFSLLIPENIIGGELL